MADHFHKTRKDSGRFPTTRWSLFEAVRTSDLRQKQIVLQHLIQNYWNPIYLFIRRHTSDVAAAEDLTQEFLTRWLARDLFSLANPSKGRFRNYLCKSIKNFLNNHHRRETARRRHPSAGFIELDKQVEAQSCDHFDPEKALLRALACEITCQTIAELEQAFIHTGKAAHFYIFQRRIVEPALDGAQPVPMLELATDLGLPVKTASNYLITAKRSYKRLLRRRVCQYAANPDDADQEIADLWAYLNP